LCQKQEALQSLEFESTQAYIPETNQQ